MTELHINEATRSTTLDGRPVSLGARAFDVLTYLSQHPDRVITKEELLEHVWAGTLVEESNLTVQIAGLRKALGKDTIKTVPGVGYKFTLGSTPTASDAKPSSSAAPDVPTIPSLAVLPFANLTGSNDNAYMVDGIVNEITSALARVSSFFVISNTSTFTYRGKAVDLAEVGRDLGVRYILEGSIQKAGNRLRIFTQLVEARTARMIWHDRFDGNSADIFDLQDRVAECVAAAIEPKLIWAEAARARAKPTDSLKAYDLCMKAAPLAMRQNALSDLEEALDLLGQALALDPNYIQAKALICYAHTGSFAARWWPVEKAQAALPLAQEVLDSTTHDPASLAYAGHYVAYIGKDARRGLTALQHASVLNPNSATIAMLLGWVHNYLNENDDAIEHLQRALRLSPLHPQVGVVTSGIGNSMLQKGAFEAARGHYELAMTQFPEFATAHMGLMAIYWRLGEAEKSAQMAKFIRRKVPDMTIATFVRTRPQNNEIYRDTMIAAFRANGFPED
jgi:TolB-like protein